MHVLVSSLFRQLPPIVPGDKAAGGARHKKDKKKQVSMAHIDEGRPCLPVVNSGDLFHDRLIDPLPFTVSMTFGCSSIEGGENKHRSNDAEADHS
jgi:hypothetical protein